MFFGNNYTSGLMYILYTLDPYQQNLAVAKKMPLKAALL